MKTILLFALIMVGCSCETEWKVEEDFRPIVDSFFEEGNRFGVPLDKTNLIVMFGDPGPGVAGRAIQDGFQRVVIISPKYWNYNWNEDQVQLTREYILFHELGHALLRRSHNTEYSMMNQKGPVSDYCNKPEQREVLHREMFANR